MSAAETRFTGLMTEHGRAVLGYLTRRTEPVQDAADLTAEVFVVAWRRLDAVPGEPSQARAWLLGTARGVLANHRRGAVRRSQLADRLRQYLREEPDTALDFAAFSFLITASSFFGWSFFSSPVFMSPVG